MLAVHFCRNPNHGCLSLLNVLLELRVCCTMVSYIENRNIWLSKWLKKVMTVKLFKCIVIYLLNIHDIDVW